MMHARIRLVPLGAVALMLAGARCQNPLAENPGGSVPVSTTIDGGGAVTCGGDGDCPFGQACRDGQCRNADQDLHDRGCRVDADCPEGAACAVATGRCVPVADLPVVPPVTTGACADGERRKCGSKVGACRYGTQACADGGWAGACDGEIGSTTETCDGQDNDCDGLVDEGFTLGGACSAGLGVCRQDGTVVCEPSATATTCSVSGLDAAGRVELCGNGFDDNCNGAADEGFTLGTPCFQGVGACRREGVTLCSADQLATRCSAVAGVAGPLELCGNSIDDNCDGNVDEGFAGVVDTACTVAVGACTVTGTWRCTADRLDRFCEQPPPVGELCNGVDDNADSCIDEGYDKGAQCSDGLGVCLRVGRKICKTDGMGTPCNVTGLDPAGRTELCGNGLDDNCNGTIDEGFPDLDTVCDVGQGVCRRQGTKTCSADGRFTVCTGHRRNAGPARRAVRQRA